MFRKLKAGLGSKGSSKAKYRLDVAVVRVEGLPSGVTAARLQWARGAKVAVTKLVTASNGAVEWSEELSQIATLVRTAAGFEVKQYEFKLQAPDRSHSQKPPATIGKAALDMARFATSAGVAQQVALQIPVPGGRATLHLVVGATEVSALGLPDDDSMSVMTGASGLSSTSPSAMEQDLSGFHMGSREMSGPRDSQQHPDPIPEAVAAGSAAASPRNSVQPSALVSAEPSDAAAASADVPSRGTTGGGELAAAEVEALRKEVEGRDTRLAALQQELAATQRQLAALQLSSSEAPAPTAVAEDNGRLEELQQQNASLAQEVAAGRAELAAATVAAAAASAAAGAAAAATAPADASRLQEQLAAAEARVGELEAQLAAAAATPGRSGSQGEEAMAAKLALAEQKIEELMVLAQAASRGGSAPSEREAELAAKLAEAETAVGEAEAVAQEAMGMAEAAEAEIAELRAARAALEEEMASLQQQTEAAQSSTKWKEEREAKKEADWDARLKEAYKRMEESVLMAERTQREKDDLQDRYGVLLSEKQAIEAKLDPDAVDQQVALEVEAARRAAEAQARIEVEALQQRLRTMEEYVEEADSQRLAAASRVGELEQQLASVRRGEDDTYSQVKLAEDRADGLSLELQYAQGEAARLAAELELAREVAELRSSEAQREAVAACSRADALQQQLDEACAQARQEGAVAAQLRGRAMALEEDLEASKLQLVAAQQAAAMAVGAGLGGAAATAEAEAARKRLESDLAERQLAAEERSAQLEALGHELAGVRASLAEAQAARGAAEAQAAEAQRAAAASAATVAELEAALASHESQLAAAHEAQRTSIAMLSARGRTTAGEEGEGAAAELRRQLEEERRAHSSEVAGLNTQLSEAQALAGYSAGEMAALVQQLAEAQGERGEAAAKLAEALEEVSRLRSGPDGELRERIERLERDLMVQRNRADVNSLFKDEHDRIAQELVETKLVWAEAQEQIVKLKRSLVKSQEKNVTFSARLTKMETKMYNAANGTAESLQKGAKSFANKLSLKRSSSRDRRPPSANDEAAPSGQE